MPALHSCTINVSNRPPLRDHQDADINATWPATELAAATRARRLAIASPRKHAQSRMRRAGAEMLEGMVLDGLVFRIRTPQRLVCPESVRFASELTVRQYCLSLELIFWVNAWLRSNCRVVHLMTVCTCGICMRSYRFGLDHALGSEHRLFLSLEYQQEYPGQLS